MTRNIILFGSTGFVGEGLLKQLMQGDYRIINPVRRVNNSLELDKIEQIQFDLSQIESSPEQNNNFQKTINELGEYTIIYSVGLLREDSKQKYSDFHFQWIKNLIELVKTKPPDKFILISALGVSTQNTDKLTYYGSKRLGELELVNSGLNYAIVRPSIVWDDEDSGKYSFKKVIESLIKFPVIPVIGSGKYKFQPINRSDLSMLVDRIIRNENIEYPTEVEDKNIIYAVGKDIFSLKQLLKKQAKGLKLYLHIPLLILRFAVKLFGNFKFFPISKQQLDMLVEGNALTSK